MQQILINGKQSTIHKLSIEPYGSLFMLNLSSIQPAYELEIGNMQSDEFLWFL